MIYREPTQSETVKMSRRVTAFSIDSIPELESRTPYVYLIDNVELGFRIELSHIKDEMNNALDIDKWLGKKSDKDMLEVFLGFYRILNGKSIQEWQKSWIEKYLNDSSVIILKEKFKWNVPRPWQTAKELKVRLPYTYNAITADSPSYPSGHSAQAVLLANLFTEIDESNKDAYLSLGEMIGRGRIQLGLHYPMDHSYGKKVGDYLWKHMT